MAVPTPSNPAVRNTTGGAFVAQKQGGSVLGNTSVGDVITKALALKDNATEFINALPKALNNGLASAQKALSGGTFAYSVAGQYVIRTISTTLSGVSSDTMLIPSQASKKSCSVLILAQFIVLRLHACQPDSFVFSHTGHMPISTHGLTSNSVLSDQTNPGSPNSFTDSISSVNCSLLVSSLSRSAELLDLPR